MLNTIGSLQFCHSQNRIIYFVRLFTGIFFYIFIYARQTRGENILNYYYLFFWQWWCILLLLSLFSFYNYLYTIVKCWKFYCSHPRSRMLHPTTFDEKNIKHYHSFNRNTYRDHIKFYLECKTIILRCCVVPFP